MIAKAGELDSENEAESFSSSPSSIEWTIFSRAEDSDGGATRNEEVDFQHLNICNHSAMEGSGAKLGEALEEG